MPNTLAHIGVHLPVTRTLWRQMDALWIYAGCVIPDVPWIGQRLLLVTTPIDETGLRLHTIAQASLLGSLVLAGALASLARRPRPAFGALGLGVLLHLLLDACQIKWANGVSLLAPFDWRLVRFDLFWPEDPSTLVLTALGLVAFAVERFRRRRRRTIHVVVPELVVTKVRLVVGMLLVAIWASWPIAFHDGPYRADSQFIRTLTSDAPRTGRSIEIDRRPYVPRAQGHAVISAFDDTLLVDRPLLDHPAYVSLRGRFIDEHTIGVEEIHDHTGPGLRVPMRDTFSYVGLALIALTWAPALARMSRGPGSGRREGR